MAATEPLWAVAVNGLLLLALIFGALLVVHRQAAAAWWRKFGEALEDVRRPLP